MKKLSVIFVVILCLVGCSSGTTKQNPINEKPKQIITKDISIDFFKCKIPSECSVEKGGLGYEFKNLNLYLESDDIADYYDSIGEGAKSSIDVFSSGNNRKITTYNSIKYLDSYSKDNPRYLFYIVDKKMIRITLFDVQETPEQLIFLNSLSYNLKGSIFNMEYFLGHNYSTDTKFEYDPNTGNKVPTGTLKKSESSSGSGNSSYGDKVYVPGYYTKRGKYVKGYYRSK